MAYVAKPHVANSVGSQTFSEVAAAVAYLAECEVDTVGSTLEEQIEELTWIGKLIEVH